MNFYSLHSLVSAQKKPIPLRQTTDSFGVAPKRREPYIEPTFRKIEFEQEKPTIILVSAVGATGKTALAQVLSDRTGLPLLDLAKHKPVGDNTLTGLLTSAFGVNDLSRVFEGIGQGTFGVIIDGIDEGRSKTTERAFEAFLDDIARLCKNASSTTFVLLGRTQILEDCWLYLTEKRIATGLITLSPFDLDGARRYIDDFTNALASSYAAEYRDVRDLILNKLSAAFRDSPERDQSFLSFVGYPPVLDAIVTLLLEEKNYHRLSGDLHGSEVKDVEIELLYRIASYVLDREKDQKVVPNILLPLLAGMPAKDIDEITKRVFGKEEQCLRLVSHGLGRQLTLGRIGEPLIDEKYEAQLVSFLPEHPFIGGRQFRNAIFEAVALSTLILSPSADAVSLALEYADGHKYNYHTVYLLHKMAAGRKVPISALRLILGSALEFRSRTSSVEINVEGPNVEDIDSDPVQTVEIEIEIIMGSDEGQSRSFAFQSALNGAASVNLGHRFSATYVSLPCDVVISSPQELEFTAPAEISAKRIRLQSPALILRAPAVAAPGRQVLLEAEALESAVESVITNGVDFVCAVEDRAGLTYPVIQYVEERETFSRDASLKEKYLRLRRILVHFRSHGKGALAKYRHKIEHERVLKNAVGQAILERLLEDGILTRDGSFYFLQPQNVDKHLGVSWIDLRKGRTSAKLEQYLRSVG